MDAKYLSAMARAAKGLSKGMDAGIAALAAKYGFDKEEAGPVFIKALQKVLEEDVGASLDN